MTAPAIILSRPQLGENIGAAARAMKNFGLKDLRLVAPRDGWPSEKAVHMAAGAADLLDTVRLYDDVPKALGDLQLVVCRDRARARRHQAGRDARRKRRASCGQPAPRALDCGLLFGNERSGLDNDEISLATAVVTIPTAAFSSLNLAQSVMLLCYEWFCAADATPSVRIDHGPHRKEGDARGNVPARSSIWRASFSHPAFSIRRARRRR